VIFSHFLSTSVSPRLTAACPARSRGEARDGSGDKADLILAAFERLTGQARWIPARFVLCRVGRILITAMVNNANRTMTKMTVSNTERI
jgi:hypothetical protein